VLTVIVVVTVALVTTAITLVVLRPDGSIPTTVPAATPPTPISSRSVATPTPRSPSPTTSPSPRVLVSEDFTGKDLPAGWTPYEGRWKVTGGRLEATTDGTRSRIAFGPKRVPENYRIDATIRFVRVKDSGRWLNIGLDYHVKDDVGGVFVVRSDTTADNGLELAQRKSSKREYVSDPVRAARKRAGVDQDHRLSIEVRGSRIDVTMDGQRVFDADNLARTGGQLGLVINNATVQFDDVTVTRRDA
jgi:glycerophosphoryl diester phosphodiesterase